MTCGNPILLEFLKDWWDEAREQGHKKATTLKRAHDSMKACPISFSHPSEAQQLNGIGPAIVEKLTRAYETYCGENDISVPAKPRGAKRRATADAIKEHNTELLERQAQPKRRRTGDKPYVPQERSGPYAILLALYQAEQVAPEGRAPGMIRQHLIEAAQEYCDVSFEAPENTRSFYTAWSSMKGLTERSLVSTRGQPARYFLTESGAEMADGIQEARRRGEGLGGGDAPPRDAPASRRTDSVQRPAGPPGRNLNDFCSDEETNRPSVTLGGYNLDPEAPDDRSEAEKNANKQAQRRRLRLMYSGASAEYGVDLPVRTAAERAAIDREVEEVRQCTLNGEKAPPVSLALGCGQPMTASVAALTRTSMAASSNASTATGSASVPPVFAPFEPTVLRSGQYTVELILDNREVRSKTDREYLQNNLITAGVTPTTRGLQVGDALWVARSGNREFVLDFIVERKRLDDLVSSIKDGRFHEQKFRLTKSGIPNVIYIIEAFSLGDNGANMTEAIETAISSTQVVNGFFVKRTAKLDDTIRYLARMTKVLRDLYLGKDIYIIPAELVESRTYGHLRQHLKTAYPDKEFYLSYDTFSSLVNKSGSTTLRDLFLKMLMCVRGISAEKALEIQRSFATPAALVEAFVKCHDDKERDEMVLKACQDAIGRRNIGGVVSKKVKEVWWGVA